MIDGKFFYNYTAEKAGVYSKFNYGVMEIKCDESKDITNEAWKEIRSSAKKAYSDADGINFTAFNKV